MKRWSRHTRLAVSSLAVLATAAVTAFGTTATSLASSGTLTVESSQQNTITQDFNPYVQSSAASLLGAVSLLYEPLYQANIMKPGQYYPFLATHYVWSKGGKSITFTIRNGVKWSDGSALTAADVAFTFNMVKQNADVNSQGLTLKSVGTSGNKVTLNFPTPQYASFQNFAANVYIVPQKIWSTAGDPGKYVDANPVGSGPYTMKQFTPQGITLGANPSYWGGAPRVGTVEFPTYTSGAAALSALQTNQLAWGGNSLIGVHTLFADAPNHKTWFAPVQTNSLEPNLTKWPTNQLAVRQAISLAIDRTALSQQAENGLEPVAQQLSGITLPAFRDFVVPTARVPGHSNIAAARDVLKKAGYVLKNGFFEKGGKTVAFNITNPSNFTDYAEGDAQIARSLQRAGMDVKFVGQATTAWSADIVSGNFSLTQHWSQTSVSPFQLYNDWLNSKLASTSGGNYERLNSSAVDAMLNKLGSDQSSAAQKRDLAPIEKYVATNLPIIPTDYGVSWDEYNTGQFSGWPTATNAYESGSPNAPTNEVVILHLRPKS